MVLRLAKGVAAIAGLTTIAAASRPAESNAQQRSRDTARAKAAEAKSKASAAASEAKKAEAQAAAAAAESKAREAEALAKTEASRIAAAAEAERAKTAAAAEAVRIAAEKEKREFEAREGNTQKTLFNLGLAVAAGIAGVLVGNRFGGAAVKKIVAAAGETMKSVKTLGAEASKITATKGVLTGTAQGDKLRGVVNEAYALGGVKTAFASPGYKAPPKAKELFGNLGKPDAAAFALPALSAGQGAGALIASTQVEDKSVSTALRVEGTIALVAGLTMVKPLLAARATSLRPSSKAIAAIEAGRNRLVREAKGPAPRMPTRAPAAKRSRKAAPASGGTYTRTYRSGPKAGITETVTKR
jgi:chemotaxis protein histidine kinase CheA